MDAHSSDIVAPAKVPHFALKPIIKELVRTQVCFPNLKLLIDKVSIVALPKNEHTTGAEAYRLFLTDGEKTIQGMRSVGDGKPCELWLSIGLLFSIAEA